MFSSGAQLELEEGSGNSSASLNSSKSRTSAREELLLAKYSVIKFKAKSCSELHKKTYIRAHNVSNDVDFRNQLEHEWIRIPADNEAVCIQLGFYTGTKSIREFEREGVRRHVLISSSVIRIACSLPHARARPPRQAGCGIGPGRAHQAREKRTWSCDSYSFVLVLLEGAYSDATDGTSRIAKQTTRVWPQTAASGLRDAGPMEENGWDGSGGRSMVIRGIEEDVVELLVGLTVSDDSELVESRGMRESSQSARSATPFHRELTGVGGSKHVQVVVDEEDEEVGIEPTTTAREPPVVRLVVATA
ncbi:hypothetical protein EDB86DRAFT_3155430 [Lactarius hatsudake]|nr:hypothetical protein EDB86DRAFT_3155430 [Lactarius hatsudake]